MGMSCHLYRGMSLAPVTPMAAACYAGSRARRIPASANARHACATSSPCGCFAPPARCRCPRAGRWGSGAPLTLRGCGGRCGRKSPVLLQRLERPHPDTIDDPAPGNGRRFDGLEYLLLGRSVREGTAHVGLDPILHKPGQRILSTSAEIPDCIPPRGGSVLYAVRTSSKSHNCCT